MRAREWRRCLESSSDIVFVPYEDAYGAGFEDMRRRVPDTRKAFGLVGFEARTPLLEIIDRVAEHDRVAV